VIPSATGALKVVPKRIAIRPGRVGRVRVHTQAVPGSSGTLDLTPAGGEPLALPWIVRPATPAGTLLPSATMDDTTFAPSDIAPGVLTVAVGSVDTSSGVQIEPAARLDVLLYTAEGTCCPGGTASASPAARRPGRRSRPAATRCGSSRGRWTARNRAGRACASR
jgi:hypothetical protein